MEKQNFVDYVKIHCKSGKGGAGSVHFHRDKNTMKGGPDGGDGGRGQLQLGAGGGKAAGAGEGLRLLDAQGGGVDLPLGVGKLRVGAELLQ